MPRLTLAVEPTFQAPVAIPVPGSTPVPVRFTFKHRTRDELQEHIKSVTERAGSMDDVDLVMSVAQGWDLDEPFNQENVRLLVQKFHAAAEAISTTYVTELTQARLKN